MSMYLACRYCGKDSTAESNFSVCADPEHIAQARKTAQLSFDATTGWSSQRRKEAARLLAMEVGLRADYFINPVSRILRSLAQIASRCSRFALPS